MSDSRPPTPGAAGFRAQGDHRGRGRVGEEEAAAWLESQGYRVLARNVGTRAGEIDLVAADDDTLCFVEVKARSSEVFGPAVAAVPWRKQRRLARAAALYLARKPWRGPCRFDVLGLDLGPAGFRFTLVRDAFRVPDGGR